MVPFGKNCFSLLLIEYVLIVSEWLNLALFQRQRLLNIRKYHLDILIIYSEMKNMEKMHFHLNFTNKEHYLYDTQTSRADFLPT